ncbi:MAG: adenylate kinase, partial [Halobacteriales archaeon]
LTGRRECPECGATYHVEFEPPETEGVCEECGADLVQREDDTEEVVRNRLDVYHENTAPVVEHYEDDDAFVRIDGNGTPDEVWDAIKAAIEAAT